MRYILISSFIFLFSCSDKLPPEKLKISRGYTIDSKGNVSNKSIYPTYEIDSSFFASLGYWTKSTAKGVIEFGASKLAGKSLDKLFGSLPKSSFSKIVEKYNKNIGDSKDRILGDFISKKSGEILSSKIKLDVITDLTVDKIIEEQAQKDLLSFRKALENKNSTERAMLYESAFNEARLKFDAVAGITPEVTQAAHLQLTLRMNDILTDLSFNYVKFQKDINKTVASLQNEIRDLESKVSSLTKEQKNELLILELKQEGLIQDTIIQAGKGSRAIASINENDKKTIDEYELKIRNAANKEEQKSWQDKWQIEVNTKHQWLTTFNRNTQMAAETASEIQKMLFTHGNLNEKDKEKINKTVAGLTAIAQFGQAYATGNPAAFIGGVNNMISVFSNSKPQIDPTALRHQEIMDQFNKVFEALEGIQKLQEKTYTTVIDFWNSTEIQFEDIKTELKISQGNESIILETIKANSQLLSDLSMCKEVLRSRVKCNEDDFRTKKLAKCYKSHAKISNPQESNYDPIKASFIIDDAQKIYTNKIITGSFNSKESLRKFLGQYNLNTNINKCLNGLQSIFQEDISENLLIASKTNNYSTGYKDYIFDVYNNLLAQIKIPRQDTRLFYFLTAPPIEHQSYSHAQFHHDKLVSKTLFNNSDKLDEMIDIEDFNDSMTKLIDAKQLLLYSSYLLEIHRMLSDLSEEDLEAHKINYSKSLANTLFYRVFKHINISIAQQNILSGEFYSTIMRQSLMPISPTISRDQITSDNEKIETRKKIFNMLSNEIVLSGDAPIMKNFFIFYLQDYFKNNKIEFKPDYAVSLSDYYIYLKKQNKSEPLSESYINAVKVNTSVCRDENNTSSKSTECLIQNALFNAFDSSLNPQIEKIEQLITRRKDGKEITVLEVKYFMALTYKPDNLYNKKILVPIPSFAEIVEQTEIYYPLSLNELTNFRNQLLLKLVDDPKLLESAYYENRYIF